MVLSVPAQAQDEDLGTLVQKVIDAMELEKWEEALVISDKTIAEYGKNKPYERIGARFGTIYYRKGLCELKLKKWNEAMKSFEICYRDFPNKGNAGGNEFEKRALIKWGDAAVGAEDWEQALSLYQKFLVERDKKRDNYPKGAFHIGLAICHYQLGRLPEGNENLEIAIKNKLTFPTPDAGIVAGFQALVTGAILKQNEQALLDFIAKNRGDIAIDPYLMQQFTGVFMKLAADAGNADMERAAMALYQFVPFTEVAIEDLKVRLKTFNGMTGVKDGNNLLFTKNFEASLATLESEKRGKNSAEMVKLAATAYLHEKNGNIRGAFAAYLQLENFYPTSEKREDNLYNLVRTSSLVAKGSETQRLAELFVKTFPSSKYVPAVRRMMLSVLFYDNEYELCIEVAEPLIDKLPSGSPEHDICLHVLGGSYFYTGQYDKAQPLLEKHVATYPESLFVIPATYFAASNMVRLQFWTKAATLLDAFLTKYPDAEKNFFLPFALYDRATCYYAEEQNEEALVKLERLITEFQNSNVIEGAYNLKGNVEQSTKNKEAAEKSYLTALEIAEKRRNHLVAGEALFSLVALIGEAKGKEENPRFKEAVAYADRFWKDFAEGSPYKTRVSVAQVPALNSVGRGEEALERLNEVIVEMAKDPEARGLEALINSYTAVYLEKHTPEELKEHYFNFRNIRAKDVAARALLRVAVIGVFEGVAKTSEDEKRKSEAAAMIKVLFQQLKADFAVKDLTNFILVKVGDFLRNNTATPREALPYYDEALSRQDQSYRFPALLGRADVYGRSALPADIDKGLEDFNRVYADSQDKPDREFALYRIVELHMAKKDFAKAAEQALLYLDREKTGFAKYSPQVGLLMAKSFEERNQLDDALSMYVKVWSAHMGNIKISAPAISSWMRLSWERNKASADPATVPGDRQGAYNGGANFIQLTGRFKEKMTESDLELWKEVEKLTQQYEADPSVKSLEEQKKEKEDAKK